MQSTRQYEKAMTTLVFMKKRLRLALNYARSTPMSQDESLLARADRNTRHRLMFIQKFPMRILMLVAVGTFFFFFVSENKVGLMVMMFIMGPVVIPISVFVGIYVTTQADPYDVNLRREYMRLCAIHQGDAPEQPLAQRERP